MNSRVYVVATGAICALLVGCGGGSDASSSSPPPPPPPPATITRAEAFRFLNQASFGATDEAAQQVISQGYEPWIDAQLALPASLELPAVDAAYAAMAPPVNNFAPLQGDRVAAWFENSVRGNDQLRQRVAFALSEIMVVSEVSLKQLPWAVADYYDTLARDAFGSYRQLIEDVTLHPAMGVYLSMLGNHKPDAALNIRPDENYARELMQLFSIGLVQLNLDGSTTLDGQGQPIPTYDQATVEGFAHVYTGWNWAGGASFRQARPSIANQSLPMQAYAVQHDTGQKLVLGYPGAALQTIPAGQTPVEDLADALDNIANHPNVAPFVSLRLIQRLVTSNPSAAYVARVATVFNDDGTGQRGNLGAVVKAILLDSEARTTPAADTDGKLKEPLLRLTQLWRAYNVSSGSGKLVVPQLSDVLGQKPLQAPSVFNFFSPFYGPPGEITDQGLVAPEMQIATEYQNTQVTNYLFATAFCYIPKPLAVCPARQANSPILDTAAETAVMANSGQLVDKIADRLLAGRISPALRTEAVRQVDLIPTNLPELRVAEALFLISSSPEFARQP
ncbi:MAG: DUF1800 domain-containing protein [Gammaproteobacteria bacterium]